MTTVWVQTVITANVTEHQNHHVNLGCGKPMKIKTVLGTLKVAYIYHCKNKAVVLAKHFVNLPCAMPKFCT